MAVTKYYHPGSFKQIKGFASKKFLALLEVKNYGKGYLL